MNILFSRTRVAKLFEVIKARNNQQHHETTARKTRLFQLCLCRVWDWSRRVTCRRRPGPWGIIYKLLPIRLYTNKNTLHPAVRSKISSKLIKCCKASGVSYSDLLPIILTGIYAVYWAPCSICRFSFFSSRDEVIRGVLKLLHSSCFPPFIDLLGIYYRHRQALSSCSVLLCVCTIHPPPVHHHIVVSSRYRRDLF